MIKLIQIQLIALFYLFIFLYHFYLTPYLKDPIWEIKHAEPH